MHLINIYIVTYGILKHIYCTVIYFILFTYSNVQYVIRYGIDFYRYYIIS